MFKLWKILVALFLVINSFAASSVEETDWNSKALNISRFSQLILEKRINPSHNMIIDSMEVPVLLNALSLLPWDNPLRSELFAGGIYFSPEAVDKYLKYILENNIATSYKAILLPKDFRLGSLSLKEFGTSIEPILDEGRIGENVEYINSKLSIYTKGRISNIISVEDLRGSGLSAVIGSYLNLLWIKPFSEEVTSVFNTIKTSKPVRSLWGIIWSGYRQDSEGGEIISIPLEMGAKFVVYNPPLGTPPKFFVPSMLEGIVEQNLSVTIPKLDIKSSMDLREVLKSIGFSGIEKPFISELRINQFYQKVALKTTLTGVESSFVAMLKMVRSAPKEVKVDRPHSIAIIVPYEGTYVPLYTGYIGDPTLS